MLNKNFKRCLAQIMLKYERVRNCKTYQTLDQRYLINQSRLTILTNLIEIFVFKF